MDYTKILKQSWETVWKFRALWLFGAILAFTTTSGLWWVGFADQDEIPLGTSIKVTQENTIYLPGEGLHIDLTTPGGVTFYVEDMGDLRDIRDISPVTIEGVTVDIWSIVIIGLVWILGLIVAGLIARYVSGAALIGMVNEGEDLGETVGIRRGLRLGFSRFAWRLFFVDLLVFLLFLLAVALLVVLVLVPLLTLATATTFGKVFAIIAASGLFFVGVVLLWFASIVISMFVQVIRRACVQDDLGVFAGIRRGFATIFRHPGEMVIIWLIWIGVRLTWTVVSIPMYILLAPVVIVMVLLGVVFAAVPALIAAGISSFFLAGILPWVIGGLVGLPVFIVVAAVPLAYLNGLVEIFKSNLWTYSYRELRPLEAEAQEPAPSLEPPQIPIPETEASGIG